MKLLMIFLAAAASIANAADPQYMTSCSLEVIGNAGTVATLDNSNYFTLATASGNSMVKIDFDNFTLSGEVGIRQPPGSPLSGPTLLMQLYKDRNPVQGNLASIFVQGLDLDLLALNHSRTSESFAFLTGNFGGISFSRVNYKCSVIHMF
jgi:hypothetical protein